MAPTLRERLAARHIVVPDPVLRGAQRAKSSLSAAWHRDARRIGRKTVHLEQRTVASLNGWFARLKPKVHHVEHRVDDAVRRLVRRA
ncbi:MAG: hypothetical protein ABR562_00235 [Thermoplasmatota archaeon]|nr:hypothetical protein [Halobacteriales archaeon]